MIVVGIEVTGVGGSADLATGTVIADGLVLTVAHALPPLAAILVALPNGTRHHARILARDPGLDAALLAVDGAAATATFAEPRLGPVRVGLRPVSPAWRRPVRARMVRRIQVSVPGAGNAPGTAPRRPGFELALTVHPGDSGSPVTDAKGSMVGMVFGIARARPITYATSSAALVPFIRVARRRAAEPARAQ